jgi:type IV secretory pathway VirB2 component (pilin)
LKKYVSAVLGSRVTHVVALGAVFATANAFAGGVAMPWDNGLVSISRNLTTTTALGLTIMGAAGTVGSMIWHGDMNEFARKGSYIALAGGFMLGIPQVVTYLGITGAVV